MKNIFLIVLIGLFFRVNAQELITNSGVKLKPGIYKNSAEFRLNSPSITLVDSINVKEYKYSRKKPSHLEYRIIMSSYKSDSIGSVFGFCEDEDLYINFKSTDNHFNNIKSINKSVFQKITTLGRYSIFSAIIFKNVGGGPYMGGGTMSFSGGGTIVKKCQKYLIDLNTLDVYELNKTTIKKILKNDVKLYLEYKSSKKKNELLEEYIVKYNELHKNEIKEINTEIIIYNRQKEIKDSIEVSLNNQIYKIGANDYITIDIDYTSNLKVTSKHGNTITTIPAVSKPTYIECLDKQGAITLKRMDLGMGEYNVDRLKKKTFKQTNH